MPKKHRLFSDVTTVSRSARIALHNVGLINKDDTVVSWTRLSPFMRDRTLTNKEAKQLVLLELEQETPRKDILNRLVSYLSYSGKEQTMKQLEKILTK